MTSYSTQLHKVIVHNNVKKIRELLETHPKIIDRKHNNLTPLHVAIIHRNVEAVKLLLEYGAQTNPCNFYVPPPLYYAIVGVRNLLRKKNILHDIDTKIDNCNTIIKMLVEKGAELIGLEIAISTKNLWLIKFLIDKGINMRYTGFFPGELNYNSIDIEICKILLEANIDINDTICGDTLLRYAIRASNLKLVRFLVENGADIEKRNEKEQDPNIVEAVEKGNVEVVKYLIDSGLDVNKFSIYTGKPAIHCAILLGHYDMVKLLLERGSNPFFLYHDNTSLIRVATQAKKNRLRIVKLLLSYGVKLYGDHDSYLQTPLLDYSKDTYSIITILLENGLKITSTSILYSYVSNYTSLRIFKKLISSIRNVDVSSPLHYSAASNKVWRISKFLLQQGAEVNIRNRYGITPLFEAIDNGADKNIKLLLDYDADINYTDNEGNAMLMKILYHHYKVSGEIKGKHLRAARIILPYLRKLELKYPYIKNFHPFKQNINLFSLDVLKNIKDKSDKEIDRMKNTVLREVQDGSNKLTVTMYDILLERKLDLLISVIKNPMIKRKCSELEPFRRLIRNNIKRIEDRYVNIHNTKKDIDEYVKNSGSIWYVLPYEIKVNILCYLNDKELMAVRNAVKYVER
ncbi:ankyrin repeat containing protein [Finch poxvirus]|uniref:Ankyrin repeat containing protein n=2 Tax=unclassified Avipoxvirus TaxID=336487 RepID=A0AAT9UQU0_9POXV|nr:ankyrin repeat containing protein [Finch poxvirus]UOX38872.1 ankyrin repeat containing protein [Finch poxvirus]